MISTTHNYFYSILDDAFTPKCYKKHFDGWMTCQKSINTLQVIDMTKSQPSLT
jgi:hypothetical protein